MQFTSESLKKFTETTIEKQTRLDHSIVSVFLTGSMVTEESPLLGGTADIDLVFIHIGDPKAPREILRLTDEVHFDIAHHPQRDYMQRLELRVHPWLGPMLAEAVVLYDPQHFVDLTQASVRGLFNRPENVVKRASAMHESARKAWNEQPNPDDPGPPDVARYLWILERGANAVALLAGEPLAERRFLLKFPGRAEAVNRPGLAAGLLGLLGAPRIEPGDLASWMADWKAAWDALPEEGLHPRLHPYRRSYYRAAFDSVLASGQPENVLWPLLCNWTLAARFLPEGDPAIQLWKDACQKLGLLGSEFSERLAGLDAFLEQAGEIIEAWAIENGG